MRLHFQPQAISATFYLKIHFRKVCEDIHCRDKNTYPLVARSASLVPLHSSCVIRLHIARVQHYIVHVQHQA